jgi:hypothetical protein
MTIYPKLNSRSYKKYANGFCTRMKNLNKTYTLSNRNFNVEDFEQNSLSFVEERYSIIGRSDIANFIMKPEMTLRLNFT